MDRINSENTILKDGKRLFKDGDPSGDIPEQPTAVNGLSVNTNYLPNFTFSGVYEV